MKNILLPFLIICICLTNYGQSTLCGNIYYSTNIPMEFASVKVMTAQDSVFVNGAITDSTGAFKIENLETATYIVQVSMMGYTTYFSQPIAIETNQIKQVAAITLAENTQLLDAVHVISQKPTITNTGDKITLHVENTTLSIGGNALDVIERAPGVTLDNDENIRIMGKQGVMVLINDKQVYFTGDQLTTYLKNLSSEQIASIEVISNPSSKYDAQGNAGVLNIVLKKNKLEGINGSVQASSSIARETSYSVGGNLNYMHKNLNLSIGYHYNDSRNNDLVTLNRIIPFESEETHIDELLDITSNSPDNNAFIAADYTINKNNSIGLEASGFINPEKTTGFTTATLTDKNALFLFASETQSNESSDYLNYALNINYIKKFDTSGKKLTTNLDYAYYNGSTKNDFETNYFNVLHETIASPTNNLNNNPADVDIKSAKIDYTQPLKGNASFEAGIKSSYVVTDNEIIVSNLIGSDWLIDATQSNHFIYSENINAAYINFSKQLDKISLSGGLRAEQTNSTGNSVTLDESFSKHYINLFPSFSVNEMFSEKHMLGLNYSRRINRPSYQDLNPFLFYLDPYVYIQGNPDLVPEITHAVDLTYTFKQTYMVSASYSNTNNYIINLIYQNDSTNITYQTPDNFDSYSIYALTFYTPFDIAKWWSITPVVTVYNLNQKTDYEGTAFNKNITSFNVDLTQNFMLLKNFSAEVSAHYENAGYWGILKYKSFYTVNASVKKSFLHDKAFASVSVNDIFNSGDIEGDIQLNSINTYLIDNSDNRFVKLALTYNFGSLKQNHVKNSGSEDEMNRVKMGGS